MKKAAIVFLCCMLLGFHPSLLAQLQNDSLLGEKSERCNYSQWVVPAGLVLGGSLLGVERWHAVDDAVNDWMLEISAGNYWQGDDYLQYVPVVTQFGLDFAGVEARHSFKERTLLTATAYASMGVMVLGLKNIVSEKRPDSPAHNSFPSGHTATAFMGAELMRMEYGWGWGLAGYSVATCVAFLRMYNGRHWLNDVIAGAGFGILSARLALMLLPFEKRLFHFDNQVSLQAFYDGQTFGACLQLHL